ncbi:MAG: ABC transporter permease subunit [Rhodospirillaceae bacterium]
MAWLSLDPITRRRLARFKAIKRGYYSLLILLGAMVLSIFAPYLAESRALMVIHQGDWRFPTFQYLSMATFGQTPPPGWTPEELETEYMRLKREWQIERTLYAREAAAAGNDSEKLSTLAAKYPNRNSYVIMPAIPWDPYQSDFSYSEALNDIQAQLKAGAPEDAERNALRNRLDELAGAIHDGSIDGLLTDPKRSTNGTLTALARTTPSLARFGRPAPNPPDAARGHYLGTDAQGRDVASRLLYGFRISIFFSLFLVITGQVIGTFVGSVQGYFGGKVDILSQRIVEVMVSLPLLYVVIILAALVVPNFWMLLGIMALFQWIDITFYMRTETYREKTKEYCLAARSYGASHLRIIFRHLLPNCLTPLVTFTPFLVVGAIFSLTALDYLGYGLPAPTPSWGELIDQALDSANRDKLWLTFAPFTAITITLLLVTFIGESVREAFDPKQYAKYE